MIELKWFVLQISSRWHLLWNIEKNQAESAAAPRQEGICLLMFSFKEKRCSVFC